MSGYYVVTADEMRRAEAEAVAAGTSVETLMERAGQGAAEAIRRFAGPLPALILCGPGNNGGDGYVIARLLRESGVDVRVAAFAEPASAAARTARDRWDGPVGTLEEAAPAPLCVDALFGTGLTRPLDDDVAALLCGLAWDARVRVAIDLPSGVATDDGRILSSVPEYDLTVTFARMKPSHLLQPAARFMGRIVTADIGIHAESKLHAIGRPHLIAVDPDYHKFDRGYVAVLGGEMPGAAALAASAALRAGAGYVRLLATETIANVPSAIVQSRGDPGELIEDKRIGALVLGPGLGRSAAAAALLDLALGSPLPLIIDGDALTLLAEQGPAILHKARQLPILTPHEGEFARLFPGLRGDKVERAREAAERSRAVVVYKGTDTVVASPGRYAAIGPPASNWLASAGTGDVLAGAVAAMRAKGAEPFEAACSGVWLHNRAGWAAGPGMIADDLLAHLPAAFADCTRPWT